MQINSIQYPAAYPFKVFFAPNHMLCLINLLVQQSNLFACLINFLVQQYNLLACLINLFVQQSNLITCYNTPTYPKYIETIKDDIECCMQRRSRRFEQAGLIPSMILFYVNILKQLFFMLTT